MTKPTHVHSPEIEQTIIDAMEAVSQLGEAVLSPEFNTLALAQASNLVEILAAQQGLIAENSPA